MVLPLKREGRTLTVAMADPTNTGAARRPQVHHPLRSLPGHRRRVHAPQPDREALRGERPAAPDAPQGHGGAGEATSRWSEEQEDEAATQAQIDDAPVVKLINGLLTDAVKRGASDIHIEPFEHEIRVRYRIDGALLEVMKPPLKMKAALTSPHQDPVAAQHRRAPGAAGRPPQAEDGQPGHRLPRLDPAGALRREDRACESSTRAT